MDDDQKGHLTSEEPSITDPTYKGTPEDITPLQISDLTNDQIGGSIPNVPQIRNPVADILHISEPNVKNQTNILVDANLGSSNPVQHQPSNG